MAEVVVKGIRQTDGRKVRVSASDDATRSDGSSLVTGDLGGANGIATLNGLSRVVQDPASTSEAAAADTIPKRDSNGDVLVPLTPTAAGGATSKTYVDARPAKGSVTYAGAAPTYSEADAILPALGDYGYFYKGATDPVFHLFRRSISATTLADFGIVEMT